MKTSAFAALLFALVLRGSSGQDDGAQKMDVFRLPDTSKPESYELRFVPRLDGVNSTFTGVANITVTVTTTVNVITLNVKDLNVTDVTVQDVRNRCAVNTIKLVNVERNEQFEIHLKKAVIANRRYLVSIAYHGKIRTDMSGLYLSSYEENNATKWLAVTQFEATSARKAFPCYDEPAYKAIFNITVVKQKNQIALSNMPIVETVSGADTDEVKFKSTPPMSSYLAAIYVGEFVANVKSSSLAVYGRKDYINQTGYVSNDGLKHIRALEDYTGVGYSLPKMDLLAIPEFKAGAMENWGMTTYRESFIYLHEESKTQLKIRSSEVVQHEFTHQWFGNLVTCASWNYTWLNEGFARYFQYFATKTVKTAWPIEEMFVVETHQAALEYDQTPRHPITASVQTPDEIGELFDTVTYSKAAAVLRMLRYAVTDELFKLSLRSYLNDQRENVATPDDLYAAFDNVLSDESYEFKNGMTVSKFMSNWTLTSGYPVLNITKNTTSNTFSVIQSRFSVNGTANGNRTDAPSWIVGLTFTTESKKNFSYARPDVWTNETSNLTVIAAPADPGWYIFNVQSSGFYRVNYDAANWMALTRQLDESHADIHVLNRAQLIDDAFALARAGHVNYTVPLRLTKYLTKENNTTPWRSAMKGFAYLLERMPRGERGYADLKDHVGDLAGTIYEKLELLVSAGNTEFGVLSAWDAIATWACRLDNSYCTTKALDYFKRWQTGDKIPADIKDAAFCAGVRHSRCPATFDRMFDVYTTSTSISERLSAESALGCSANKNNLTRYINHILDGPKGPIKEKDYNSVVTAISATPLGLDVLYEFLSANLNRTLNELSDGQSTVKHIYSVLASKVTKDGDIAKLRDLKDDPSLPASVKSSFEKSFEKVNENLLWFNTYSDDISQWALQNKEEEEKERSTTEQDLTTIKPFTAVSRSSTQSPQITTPKPSSASSNVYSSFIILKLTLLSLIVKTYIL